MGKYRKVDPRIWNDEKFMALSDDSKLIFLFLLTHPNLIYLGALRGNLPGLAAELKWTEKRFAIGFQELFKNGMVQYSENSSFILLPNFLKYNPPDNPNVVKSWKDSLDLLPECELKQSLIEICEPFAKRFNILLPKPFAKPLPEPYAIPYAKHGTGTGTGTGTEKDIQISQPKPQKIGEFKNVVLSLEDLEKLNSKFGPDQTKSKIEELSSYIASKGKKYSSHYATILTWDRKNKPSPSSAGNGGHTIKKETFSKCPKCGKETTKEDLRKFESCPSCFKPLAPEQLSELLAGIGKTIKPLKPEEQDIPF